jgi:tetratricopeptide (TPR) repeat protein
VVISDATYQLVQGYVVCQPLEARHLPGIPGLSALYQVLDASEARGRLDLTAPPQRTPFVGREMERAVLRERAAHVQQGQGQAVLLSGEAGMGKSRLVQEITTALAADGFSVIECRCSSYYQHTALHPVIEWVQHCIQGDGATPAPARVAHLEHLVQEAQLDCHENVPLLAALLQLDLPAARYPALQLTPHRQRQRTLEVLLTLLLARAARQPVLLIVEDLHWSDPTTLEWLGLVLAQGPTAPLLTLLTSRPTFASPWGGRTHVTHLTLSRLASQPVAQMVQWLGGDQLSAAQVQHIVTHTDGIPLFVEEVAKLVLAAHRLQGHAGPAASGQEAPETRIPATLRDALMARLDQLGPAKGTAQLGATLGREFPYALLQAVTPLEEDLVSQDLARLVEAELLYQHGAGASAVYIFKHALIQEAAYASLLRTTRQHYHQHIVQVLEAQFPDTVATQPELLAHHARCGEMWDKAVVYCRQAGEKALGQSAHREAMGYFEQALSALQHLPETRDTREQAIDLRLALRAALHPSGDYGRTLTLLREAEALAEALDDPGRLAQVSARLSNYFYNMGAYDQAIAASQRALALATASGAAIQQAWAHHQLALIYYNQGQYRRAIEGYGQTVVVLDGGRRPGFLADVLLPAVAYRARLVSCHAELGAFTEGRVLGAEGLRIAEAAAHPASVMYALWGLGLLSLRQGDLERALPLLQRAVNLCQEADLLLYFPWVAVVLGAAYTLAGRVADAVPLLTQALEQSLAMHMVFCQVLCHLPLAEAQLLAGRLEDAQRLADRALAQAREHQERGHEAYALRLLGDIAARREPPVIEPAESHYQQALTLAGELGMRPLQAHCHLRLGTLYARGSQREQAHAALSAAFDLYHAMEMTFWVPQAEAVLVQVAEG